MENYDLIHLARSGDRKAREQLLADNTGLIRMTVRRFINRGVEQEDLFQIASLGFLKAIDNFKPELGHQLSTYAVPTMMGEIRRFLRDNGPIKVSRSLKNLAYKATEIRNEIFLNTGEEPPISVIAEKLSVDPAELSVALSASKYPESLEEPRGKEGLTLKDTIPSGGHEESAINRLSLRQLIASLPAREKKIIISRYLLNQTQAQIASQLGISQVQISRIEKKILNQFRQELA